MASVIMRQGCEQQPTATNDWSSGYGRTVAMEACGSVSEPIDPPRRPVTMKVAMGTHVTGGVQFL